MSDNTASEVLRALADPTRLELLRKLAVEDEPALTCMLTKSCTNALRLSQPTMSHHINKLVRAGILLEQKQAKQKSYKLNTDLLDKLGINITKLTS